MPSTYVLRTAVLLPRFQRRAKERTRDGQDCHTGGEGEAAAASEKRIHRRCWRYRRVMLVLHGGKGAALGCSSVVEWRKELNLVCTVYLRPM
jgi:hypothetical protein